MTRRLADLSCHLWRISAQLLMALTSAVAFFANMPLSAAAASGQISLAGATLLRDGRPWLAKGVVLIGRLTPAAEVGGDFKKARAAYGPAELDAIKLFGADTIRFQVSQAGSNPQSKIYTPEYAREVFAAVELARKAGFAVIVSLQSEGPSGLDEAGMPNGKALRAWRQLAPLFAKDRGVMYELFNEPSPKGPDAVQPHDWRTWSAAMQPLITEVRQLGATNVLILDGLKWARILEGAPELADPMHQLVYAVHPYKSWELPDQAACDKNFGAFANSHAVLATEWNALSFWDTCNNDMPRYSEVTLRYLKSKNIGLVAWAYDLPGILIRKSGASPISFVGFHCGPDTDFGPGQLISNYFHTSQP